MQHHTDLWGKIPGRIWQSLWGTDSCPFDYCKPVTDHISFPLNNSDVQCENNRSGLLCGERKSGYSLALGSSKCLPCSNTYILLLIPFSLAGIALVFLLLAFKLTVAAGTINGLIFYAIIVAVNRAIFFPPNATNINTDSVLSLAKPGSGNWNLLHWRNGCVL